MKDYYMDKIKKNINEIKKYQNINIFQKTNETHNELFYENKNVTVKSNNENKYKKTEDIISNISMDKKEIKNNNCNNISYNEYVRLESGPLNNYVLYNNDKIINNDHEKYDNTYNNYGSVIHILNLHDLNNIPNQRYNNNVVISTKKNKNDVIYNNDKYKISYNTNSFIDTKQNMNINNNVGTKYHLDNNKNGYIINENINCYIENKVTNTLNDINKCDEKYYDKCENGTRINKINDKYINEDFNNNASDEDNIYFHKLLSTKNSNEKKYVFQEKIQKRNNDKYKYCYKDISYIPNKEKYNCNNDVDILHNNYEMKNNLLNNKKNIYIINSNDKKMDLSLQNKNAENIDIGKENCVQIFDNKNKKKNIYIYQQSLNNNNNNNHLKENEFVHKNDEPIKLSKYIKDNTEHIYNNMCEKQGHYIIKENNKNDVLINDNAVHAEKDICVKKSCPISLLSSHDINLSTKVKEYFAGSENINSQSDECDKRKNENLIEKNIINKKEINDNRHIEFANVEKNNLENIYLHCPNVFYTNDKILQEQVNENSIKKKIICDKIKGTENLNETSNSILLNKYNKYDICEENKMGNNNSYIIKNLYKEQKSLDEEDKYTIQNRNANLYYNYNKQFPNSEEISHNEHKIQYNIPRHNTFHLLDEQKKYDKKNIENQEECKNFSFSNFISYEEKYQNDNNMKCISIVKGPISKQDIIETKGITNEIDQPLSNYNTFINDKNDNIMPHIDKAPNDLGNSNKLTNLNKGQAHKSSIYEKANIDNDKVKKQNLHSINDKKIKRNKTCINEKDTKKYNTEKRNNIKRNHNDKKKNININGNKNIFLSNKNSEKVHLDNYDNNNLGRKKRSCTINDNINSTEKKQLEKELDMYLKIEGFLLSSSAKSSVSLPSNLSNTYLGQKNLNEDINLSNELKKQFSSNNERRRSTILTTEYSNKIVNYEISSSSIGTYDNYEIQQVFDEVLNNRCTEREYSKKGNLEYIYDKVNAFPSSNRMNDKSNKISKIYNKNDNINDNCNDNINDNCNDNRNNNCDDDRNNNCDDNRNNNCEDNINNNCDNNKNENNNNINITNSCDNIVKNQNKHLDHCISKKHNSLLINLMNKKNRKRMRSSPNNFQKKLDKVFDLIVLPKSEKERNLIDKIIYCLDPSYVNNTPDEETKWKQKLKYMQEKFLESILCISYPNDLWTESTFEAYLESLNFNSLLDDTFIKYEKDLNINLFRPEEEIFSDPGNIGEGGFGIVTKMRFLTFPQYYAIKKISKDHIMKSQAAGQAYLEAKYHSVLSHVNIIKMYGCMQDEEYIYHVLEFCSKGSIYSISKNFKKRRIPDELAYKYFCHVVNGLYYLNQMGIFHRDIKMENVLVDHKDNAKLSDFGLSAMILGKKSHSSLCGTLVYFSPEITSGTGYDWRSDIWSLGVLLYEMLVGDVPFDGTKTQIVESIFSCNLKFPDFVNPLAIDLIKKTLVVDVNKRIRLCELSSDPWMQQMWKLSFQKNLNTNQNINNLKKEDQNDFNFISNLIKKQCFINSSLNASLNYDKLKNGKKTYKHLIHSNSKDDMYSLILETQQRLADYLELDDSYMSDKIDSESDTISDYDSNKYNISQFYNHSNKEKKSKYISGTAIRNEFEKNNKNKNKNKLDKYSTIKDPIISKVVEEKNTDKCLNKKEREVFKNEKIRESKNLIKKKKKKNEYDIITNRENIYNSIKEKFSESNKDNNFVKKNDDTIKNVLSNGMVIKYSDTYSQINDQLYISKMDTIDNDNFEKILKGKKQNDSIEPNNIYMEKKTVADMEKGNNISTTYNDNLINEGYIKKSMDVFNNKNDKIYCENILKNCTTEKQHTPVKEESDNKTSNELKDVFQKMVETSCEKINVNNDNIDKCHVLKNIPTLYISSFSGSLENINKMTNEKIDIDTKDSEEDLKMEEKLKTMNTEVSINNEYITNKIKHKEIDKNIDNNLTNIKYEENNINDDVSKNSSLEELNKSYIPICVHKECSTDIIKQNKCSKINLKLKDTNLDEMIRKDQHGEDFKFTDEKGEQQQKETKINFGKDELIKIQNVEGKKIEKKNNDENKLSSDVNTEILRKYISDVKNSLFIKQSLNKNNGNNNINNEYINEEKKDKINEKKDEITNDIKIQSNNETEKEPLFSKILNKAFGKKYTHEKNNKNDNSVGDIHNCSDSHILHKGKGECNKNGNISKEREHKNIVKIDENTSMYDKYIEKINKLYLNIKNKKLIYDLENMKNAGSEENINKCNDNNKDHIVCSNEDKDNLHNNNYNVDMNDNGVYKGLNYKMDKSEDLHNNNNNSNILNDYNYNCNYNYIHAYKIDTSKCYNDMNQKNEKHYYINNSYYHEETHNNNLNNLYNSSEYHKSVQNTSQKNIPKLGNTIYDKFNCEKYIDDRLVDLEEKRICKANSCSLYKENKNNEKTLIELKQEIVGDNNLITRTRITPDFISVDKKYMNSSNSDNGDFIIGQKNKLNCKNREEGQDCYTNNFILSSSNSDFSNEKKYKNEEKYKSVKSNNAHMNNNFKEYAQYGKGNEKNSFSDFENNITRNNDMNKYEKIEFNNKKNKGLSNNENNVVPFKPLCFNNKVTFMALDKYNDIENMNNVNENQNVSDIQINHKNLLMNVNKSISYELSNLDSLTKINKHNISNNLNNVKEQSPSFNSTTKGNKHSSFTYNAGYKINNNAVKNNKRTVSTNRRYLVINSNNNNNIKVGSPNMYKKSLSYKVPPCNTNSKEHNKNNIPKETPKKMSLRDYIRNNDKIYTNDKQKMNKKCDLKYNQKNIIKDKQKINIKHNLKSDAKSSEKKMFAHKLQNTDKRSNDKISRNIKASNSMNKSLKVKILNDLQKGINVLKKNDKHTEKENNTIVDYNLNLLENEIDTYKNTRKEENIDEKENHHCNDKSSLNKNKEVEVYNKREDNNIDENQNEYDNKKLSINQQNDDQNIVQVEKTQNDLILNNNKVNNVIIKGHNSNSINMKEKISKINVNKSVNENISNTKNMSMYSETNNKMDNMDNMENRKNNNSSKDVIKNNLNLNSVQKNRKMLLPNNFKNSKVKEYLKSKIEKIKMKNDYNLLYNTIDSQNNINKKSKILDIYNKECNSKDILNLPNVHDNKRSTSEFLRGSNSKDFNNKSEDLKNVKMARNVTYTSTNKLGQNAKPTILPTYINKEQIQKHKNDENKKNIIRNNEKISRSKSEGIKHLRLSSSDSDLSCYLDAFKNTFHDKINNIANKIKGDENRDETHLQKGNGNYIEKNIIQKKGCLNSNINKNVVSNYKNKFNTKNKLYTNVVSNRNLNLSNVKSKIDTNIHKKSNNVEENILNKKNNYVTYNEYNRRTKSAKIFNKSDNLLNTTINTYKSSSITNNMKNSKHVVMNKVISSSKKDNSLKLNEKFSEYKRFPMKVNDSVHSETEDTKYEEELQKKLLLLNKDNIYKKEEKKYASKNDDEKLDHLDFEKCVNRNDELDDVKEVKEMDKNKKENDDKKGIYDNEKKMSENNNNNNNNNNSDGKYNDNCDYYNMDDTQKIDKHNKYNVKNIHYTTNMEGNNNKNISSNNYYEEKDNKMNSMHEKYYKTLPSRIKNYKDSDTMFDEEELNIIEGHIMKHVSFENLEGVISSSDTTKNSNKIKRNYTFSNIKNKNNTNNTLSVERNYSTLPNINIDHMNAYRKSPKEEDNKNSNVNVFIKNNHHLEKQNINQNNNTNKDIMNDKKNIYNQSIQAYLNGGRNLNNMNNIRNKENTKSNISSYQYNKRLHSEQKVTISNSYNRQISQTMNSHFNRRNISHVKNKSEINTISGKIIPVMSNNKKDTLLTQNNVTKPVSKEYIRTYTLNTYSMNNIGNKNNLGMKKINSTYSNNNNNNNNKRIEKSNSTLFMVNLKKNHSLNNSTENTNMTKKIEALGTEFIKSDNREKLNGNFNIKRNVSATILNKAT
ncbi:serine/threonine protein kinase, putative [Plasmodium sp. DRC-Itaito]|nr:serine/threonine protein kinase, putative [Plasmodium sp. DRC-Itaito]